MKINWKLRVKNKATLLAAVAALIALIYTILGAFGIVPPVAQDLWVQLVAVIFEILVAFGIIVDPTTQGISDSERALTYDEPRIDGPKLEHTTIANEEDIRADDENASE